MSQTIPASPSRTRRWFFRLLTAAIGLAALAFLVSRIDPDALGRALREADYRFFALSLLTAFASQFLPGYRWRVLLDYRAPYRTCWSATFVGNFLSVFTPFRMGDVARAGLLRRSDKVPLTEGLTTVLFGQLLDLSGMMIVGLLLVALAPLPDTLNRIAFVLALVVLGGLGMLYIVAHSEGVWEKRIEPILRRFLGVGPARRIVGLIRSGIDGLRILHRPAQFIYVIALTLFFWSLVCLAGWFLVRSLVPDAAPVFGVGLAFAAGIGMATPWLPGSLGTYELSVAFGMTALGLSEEMALAIVVMLRLRFVLVVVGTGILGMWAQGMSFNALRAAAEESTAEENAVIEEAAI